MWHNQEYHFLYYKYDWNEFESNSLSLNYEFALLQDEGIL